MDQTCVGLAPTTGKTRTSIYDLGFTITTFCPVATSWKLDVDGSGHRLVATLPGSSKKTTTHAYEVLWSCSRPPAPQLNVGHTGCPRRPSKKTAILVTGASHYHILQHWVGGCRGCCNSTSWCPCGCFFWRTRYVHDFCTLIFRWLRNSVGFTPCTLNGPPTGMQEQSQVKWFKGFPFFLDSVFFLALEPMYNSSKEYTEYT